jgi:hypothetical protein
VPQRTMCPKAQSIVAIRAYGGEGGQRTLGIVSASTVSFQRLAAYLPGLECPYARSGSLHSGYLEHPLGELLRTA